MCVEVSVLVCGRNVTVSVCMCVNGCGLQLFNKLNHISSSSLSFSPLQSAVYTVCLQEIVLYHPHSPLWSASVLFICSGGESALSSRISCSPELCQTPAESQFKWFEKHQKCKGCLKDGASCRRELLLPVGDKRELLFVLIQQPVVIFRKTKAVYCSLKEGMKITNY